MACLGSFRKKNRKDRHVDARDRLPDPEDMNSVIDRRRKYGRCSMAG